MDLKEAIYCRRAVREFTSQPVDEEVLKQLIDAAIQAPSTVNQQPWLFTIVQDKTLLAGISRQAKAHSLKSAAAMLASHHFQSILENPDFDIFYHAPALVVISAPEGPWVVEDCALAAENLMLAACAVGLGTCWIGFAQGWLGTSEGKSLLRLSGTMLPVAPIIVGYPRTAAAPVPRKAPKIEWIS